MPNADLRLRIVPAVLGFVLAAMPQFGSAQVGLGTGVGQSPAQPYKLEFKITRVRTLANGTTITTETREVMARDAQGRRMTATTEIPILADRPAFTFVNVHDPVDNTQTNWNTRTKQVRVIKMPSPDERRGCWSTAAGNMTIGYGARPVGVASPAAGVGSGGGSTGTSSSVTSAIPAMPRPARTQPVREDLGTDSIMGVEVHGYRTTFTTPAGQIGNDQPLVRTTESWMAPSLGIELRSTTDDPQSGKMTRELVSLDLNEPDPSTFQPPEGYEAKAEEMHPVACQQGP